MKTIKTHKPNGDIYIGRVRVYDGYRQSPVRWVEILGAVAATGAFFLITTLVMGADALV